MKMKVSQLCPTLCDPIDYTVHGILQARILEWVAFPFLLQRIFPTQGSHPGLLNCRRILYQLNHKGSPTILEWVAYPSPAIFPNPEIEPGSPAFQADVQLVTSVAQLCLTLCNPVDCSKPGLPVHHQLP